MRNVSLELSNRTFFRIKKMESLAFKELVNHSCLGEVECRHPFEQVLDQKFKKKNSLSPILSDEIFESRGSHALNFLICTEIIQSSHKCSRLQSAHLRILTQNFTMIQISFRRYVHLFQRRLTFVALKGVRRNFSRGGRT